MKLKNKKRAMMIMLSLMLGVTGCGNHKRDEKVNEGYENVLTNYLSDQDLNENYDPFGVNRPAYEEFYYTFISAAMKNLSEEEYEELYYKLLADYNLETILLYLENYMIVDDDVFGKGFFVIFRNQLEEKSSTPMRFTLNQTDAHINTLRTLVNNDEAFFKSVFSKDINRVIDCICENTHFEDRTLVEELMLNFDQYIKVAGEGDFQDQQLLPVYEKRIQEIMNMIVSAKCENDLEFSQTFYAKMLKESAYYGKEGICIYEELFGLNTAFVDNRNLKLPYNLNIPYRYLFSDSSLEEIKTALLERKISDSYEGNHDRRYVDYDNEFMELLIPLLDFDALNDGEKGYGSLIRPLIYENLKSHFKSEDEFNTFVLSLSLNKPEAQKYYFDLFHERLKDDGIDYDDFIRYTCLANHIYAHTATHYEQNEFSVTFGDLAEMPEEEYKEHISPYYESFLFGEGVDYYGALEKMRETLSQNDLGYELVYNPECYISWEYGPLHPLGGNTELISSLVNPKEMIYNGTKTIYYEYPEHYEDGEATESFINYRGELKTRVVPGFREEIIDPETNEVKTIYIVGIGDDLANYKPVRFKTYAYYYHRNIEQKELTYGGNYE